MPNPEFRLPEIPSTGAEVGQAAVPNAGVEAQIQPPDVSSAHQFFTGTTGAENLPALTLHTESAVGQAAASQASVGNAAIGQAAAGHAAIGHAAVGNAALAQGAGHAALGALAPGAEQAVSPLVQLILKMPGLTGVMSNLFEFLSSLFGANLLEAFNPLHWLQNAAGTLSNMASAGQHLAISMHIIPSSTPFLQFNGSGFSQLGPGSFDSMSMHAESIGASADAANVGSPMDNVDLEQAIFEKTSKFEYHDYSQNAQMPWRTEQMALGPGSDVYKPGMGGYYSAPSTAAAPAASAPTHSAPVHHAPAHQSHSGGDHGAGQVQKHFKANDVTFERPEVAQSASGGEYTVQSGDNLWDIARKHMGDGTKWGDIYKANAEAIGQNPDLIQPGTALRMPDGTNTIASSAGGYTVHPGDNLWSISSNHMGGGHHWGNLYHMNEGVIGANPGMIHPGQHLSLGGAESHIASAPDVGHHHHVASASTGHHHANTYVAHHSAASHAPHVAHAPAPHHAQHVAMQPGAANIHGDGGSATISAQGVFKEQTPVMAPVDGGAEAATSSAGAPLNTSFANNSPGPQT